VFSVDVKDELGNLIAEVEKVLHVPKKPEVAASGPSSRGTE